MAKAERILDLFPSYCGATDSTKLLHEVTQMLAAPLEEADTHLLRIQPGHGPFALRPGNCRERGQRDRGDRSHAGGTGEVVGK